MKTIKVSWLLIFTLSLLFVNLSEANHGKNLPSAVVVGTVYCDTCFQQDFSKTSHFISGASVAVNCANRNLKTSFYEEVKTNEHGVFEVHLPTAVSKDLKSIKGCSVRLIDSSEPFCAVASMATSSSLHLKARKEGMHIFSAGMFSFKPLKQPKFCNLKPTVHNSKEFSSNKALSLPALPATIKRKATEISKRNSFSAEKELVPTLPTLPTLPTQPTLPTLPTLPTQPTLPTLPLPSLPLPTIPLPPLQTLPKMQSPLSDKKVSVLPPLIPPVLPTPSPTIGGIPLPPNPLEPAPLLPNPLQPTPPSTGLPGIPSLPPLPTLPIPPSTGLPGSPSLPIPPSTGLPGIPSLPPLPTLPIPPSTGLPGIPSLPPLPTLPIPPSTGLPGIPSLPPLPALPTPPSPGFPSIPTDSTTKKTTP